MQACAQHLAECSETCIRERRKGKQLLWWRLRSRCGEVFSEGATAGCVAQRVRASSATWVSDGRNAEKLEAFVAMMLNPKRIHILCAGGGTPTFAAVWLHAWMRECTHTGLWSCTERGSGNLFALALASLVTFPIVVVRCCHMRLQDRLWCPTRCERTRYAACVQRETCRGSIGYAVT